MTTNRDRRPGRSARLWLVPLAVILSAPVSAWWLGRALIPDTDLPDPDYYLRPPPVGAGVAVALGLAATLITVLGLVLLGRATGARRISPRWWGAWGPAVAAGVVLGLSYRVLTVAVIGANIGAAFAVLVGGPLVVALLLWAAGWTVVMLRRPAPGPATGRGAGGQGA